MYVLYMKEYKVCASHISYIGSAKTAFRESLNSYKSAHCKFRNAFFNSKSTKILKQQKLHRYFCQEGHS